MGQGGALGLVRAQKGGGVARLLGGGGRRRVVVPLLFANGAGHGIHVVLVLIAAGVE